MCKTNIIRVLIADDHPVVRQGLAAIVELEPDLTVVGIAGDGRSAVEAFRQQRPDVTLMDLQMPEMGGVDAITAICAEFDNARIVVLTTYDGDENIYRGLRAGAKGYPQADGHRFCEGDSNGNAAGNSLEEAIVQGFMELVERDCVALWWYNRIQRPAVDLDSFDEPYLQALRDYYQSQNYQLWVLDITNDFNIPSFAAIVRRDNQTSESIALGFGTHFDPKIAMLRAVTEVNQCLALLSQHQTKEEFDDPDLKYWYKEATLANQPYLAPDQSVKPKLYADYPKYDSTDLKQDVLTCVAIAANHGLETLVLDQTRPDIELSVVKVIVPGLRHFWARFAPGRLYDVPVQMGWLSAPLTEEQLNPIPMFF